MATIEFGDNDEQTLAIMKGLMRQMYTDIYGNGRDGMLKKVDTLITLETERKEQHRENRSRLNIQIALLGLLLTLVGLLFTYETMKDHRQSRNTPPQQHSDMPPQFQAGAY